jgi:hypothetical protein
MCRWNMLPPFWVEVQTKQPIINQLFACLAYFSTLKMGAVYSSETCLDLYLITRRHTPEHNTLHSRGENLKSNLMLHITMHETSCYN